MNERLLRRTEAATFLSHHGYKIAPATLAKRAVTGGGPPFISWGRTPLYDPEGLLQWARGRCSGPRRSTSDTGCTDKPASAENARTAEISQTDCSGCTTPSSRVIDPPLHPLAGNATPVDFGQQNAHDEIGKLSAGNLTPAASARDGGSE